jgi:hypothetical protein
MRISTKTRRLLEVSANIAILVVALIIIGNFIWSRWHPKQQIEGPKIGTKVSLPGVDWADGPTLVMALQQGCIYCEESAAFYRTLHDKRFDSQPRMVAVMPGNKAEVARYLSDHGVVVDGIINASLSEINVSATPTLLLVDRSGNVRDVWVGKLDAGKKTEASRRILDSH